MKQPLWIDVPLSLVVDLVNTLYVFHRVTTGQHDTVTDQLKIAQRAADSGVWWRLFYIHGFHASIAQANAKIATTGCSAAACTLSEARTYLPYLPSVTALLEIWRNPQSEDAVRREVLLEQFPLDVRRVITADAAAQWSQLYEEQGMPHHGSFGSLYQYLNRCPLPNDMHGALTVQTAVRYWGWLDHVIVLRTIGREESCRDVKLRRMRQAIQWYHLVQHIRAVSGCDLRSVSIRLDDEFLALLTTTDIIELANVVDQLIDNQASADIPHDIFIEATSLGTALRTLHTTLLRLPMSGMALPA